MKWKNRCFFQALLPNNLIALVPTKYKISGYLIWITTSKALLL
jgi:hypothetical protein